MNKTKEEIFKDNLYKNMTDLIGKYPHLDKWILSAMQEYADRQVLKELEELLGCFKDGIPFNPQHEIMVRIDKLNTMKVK